jgi:RNA polymerase sigma-70 factor (ECF subfamily)
MSVAMPSVHPVTAPLDLSSIGDVMVRAAQAGDPEARHELARSCHRVAYLFALQLTGQRDDAQELSQDAMVRFFGSLSRFDADRPLRPWLLRIVRNLARDRARRMRVRRIEPLEPADDSMVLDPADPGPSPEEAVGRIEMQRLLWRAVRALPRKHREVVALRDYQDLSYDEIATVLQIPRGTVMSRLHRARSSLRKELGGRLRKEVTA